LTSRDSNYYATTPIGRIKCVRANLQFDVWIIGRESHLYKVYSWILEQILCSMIKFCIWYKKTKITNLFTISIKIQKNGLAGFCTQKNIVRGNWYLDEFFEEFICSRWYTYLSIYVGRLVVDYHPRGWISSVVDDY
jgi:hypothetical protein